MGGAGERSGDIGVMDLSSGTITPLEIEGSGKGASGMALTGVFSPEARQIVYTWATDDKAELRISPRQPRSKMRILVGADQYGIKMPLGWSTAGSILALGQNSDQTIDLFTVNATSGAVTRVKALGFRVSPGPHVASFSTDGRHVAYEQFTAEPASFTNIPRGANLERQIHVIATDGSGDVPITTGAGVKRWPVWTANGSHVLFMSNVAGAWDLWAVPMKAGRPAGAPSLVKKNLGEVMSLGVSSTGVYHFFEGRAGVFKTTVTSVAGQRATIAESFVGTLPAWSPDGTKLAVSRPRTGGGPGMDVIIRTVATGEERVYRKEEILGFPFIWLPDGNGLLVQVREAPNTQFWYRLDLPAGTFTRLVQQRGNPEFWTHQNVRTVSADGRTLFFGTYANQKDSELDRITALDLQTGNYRDVVKFPLDKANLPTAAQDIVLAASPDGKSLAVMLYDHKNKFARLAIVGVDGQGYRELLPKVDASTLRNKLAWSADGRWIYFSTIVGKPDDETFRVMRVAATGGTPEVAGPDVIGLECFSLSPDGTRLAYSTLRPEGWGQLLWALDVSLLMKASR
jgi:Tol biopolymer transport system component